ncbi:uncharacterized protein LOC134238740 [Saccostrea cucullata]|uniref:uncharacterized protein LOC134238740 n=1 Tax=Saccostrea cuccullata TaxID=36930 RepID=UPI002ED52C0A
MDFFEKYVIGIRLDGYEVWKTEISEKYKQLSNEERAALFLLLCSNDNTFILESTDTFTTRVLEICGTKLILKSITESIQTLQSKGFVFIKDKKVTFASDGVQDETMFDYLHTCWKRRKTDFQEMVMFKDIRKRKNCLFCPFIEGQLLKVSLESSVKYFRSQSYRKGKFVRCFTLKEYRRTFGTYASL